MVLLTNLLGRRAPTRPGALGGALWCRDAKLGPLGFNFSQQIGRMRFFKKVYELDRSNQD